MSLTLHPCSLAIAMNASARLGNSLALRNAWPSGLSARGESAPYYYGEPNGPGGARRFPFTVGRSSFGSARLSAATVLARPLKPLPGDAPLGHRPNRRARAAAQLLKAPEALAVWVAMASIKAGDKAS